MFSLRPLSRKHVTPEKFAPCETCQRLKTAHSSAVNVYGESVQKAGSARGSNAKVARQGLLKAIEECEKTKAQLIAHQARCDKLDSSET